VRDVRGEVDRVAGPQRDVLSPDLQAQLPRFDQDELVRARRVGGEQARVGARRQGGADSLAGRGLPFLVAETGGAVTGYAYASPWRPKPAYRHTVEDSVYLAPGQRGRGLGRLLLEALLTGCADAGVRQVIAVIADSGDPASVLLHRACGFTDAGRLTRVGFKHGRWVDTLLMQRALEPGGRA
jgi:L-amino acid N-acyltransferase YncA